MTSEEVREKAVQMRKSGQSYREISEQLGVSRFVVGRWCDPDTAANYRERQRAYAERLRKAKYDTDPRFRVCRLLASARKKARDRGYAPVDATVDDVLRVHDRQGGCCAICGRPEDDCSKRLSIDHCHRTGRFRGLLCQKCNASLAVFDAYGDRVSSYLAGTA